MGSRVSSSLRLSEEYEGEVKKTSPLIVEKTSIFDEHFPHYLAMGMTYREFWEEDVNLVKAYRKAREIKFKEYNYNAWLQGVYFYKALLDASEYINPFIKSGTSNPKLLERPISFDEKPDEQQQDDQMHIALESFKSFVKQWKEGKEESIDERINN